MPYKEEPRKPFPAFRKEGNGSQTPGQNFKMVAKTMHGFEQLLSDEIEEMGGRDLTVSTRAVEFYGDTELMYRVNLCSRLTVRVLKPIISFKAENENKLYGKVQSIDWQKFLNVDQTFAIDSAVHSEIFNHSHYVSLKVKDAIVDQFREKTGSRPSIELKQPDVRLNIHIYQDSCTLSLDSSGRSLHRRGYKTEQIQAPMNEVMAAGLILLSGWNGETDFIDPMCGSGTLTAEAALMAENRPPGLLNGEYAFKNWQDFDRTLWRKVVDEAESKIKPAKCEFYVSDIEGRNVRMAERNLKRAGIDATLSYKKVDFFKSEVETTSGTMIINPPYGERLPVDEIQHFYSKIGDKLKTDFAGHQAWILSSDLEALKFVGLRPSRKIEVYNGKLECRFCRFDIYEGSKKMKKQKD